MQEDFKVKRGEKQPVGRMKSPAKPSGALPSSSSRVVLPEAAPFRPNETSPRPTVPPRPRKKRPAAQLALALALFLALGGAYQAVLLWRGPIQRLEIRGISHLKRQEVILATGLKGQVALNGLDPYEVSLRVAAHPWLYSADVRREFPSKLVIAVQERRPAAWVSLAGLGELLVDEEGVVLASQKQLRADHGGVLPEWSLSLPNIVTRSTPGRPGERMAALGVRRGLEVVAQVERLGWMERGRLVVDTSHPLMTRLMLPGGKTTLLLKPGEERDELALYHRLAKTGWSDLNGAKTLDLRMVAVEGRSRVFIR